MILAFDQATRTGWAAGDSVAPPVWDSFELPRTGNDIAAFLLAFRDCVENLLDRFTPHAVYFEQPIRPGATSLVTLRKLYGLANEIEILCKPRGIRCRETRVSEWRKDFIGFAAAPRKLPLKERRTLIRQTLHDRCLSSGWETANDDEASALGILVYAWACEGLMTEGQHGTYGELNAIAS